ncbi:unnamed protein product [Bursaphelenchus xylophilus]|uniref:(pine wood nematode) hypothetical protein n=1 Tax=Bursaphelenchus xylophilus TaxID=6326 RepID=A0A1I7SRS2_BURXY|nr:unnamed protein product [Bursaphelenchus xylophilus]CAG9101908.1 unnamed protein product [Bursaphelenchus xylophilus]
MRTTLISILLLGAARLAASNCRVQDYPIVLKLSDCSDFYWDAFAPLSNSRIEFVLVGKPSDIGQKGLLWAAYVNQWELASFKTKLSFDADSSTFLLEYHDSHTGSSRQVRLENLRVAKPDQPFNLLIQIFQSKLAYGVAEEYEEEGVKKFKVTKKVHRLADHKLHDLYREILYETTKQYVIGIRADASVDYKLHFLPQFWYDRTAVQENITIPKIIPHDRAEQAKDPACFWCWIGFALALLVGLFTGAAIIFIVFFCIYKKKVNALNDRRRRAAKAANKLGPNKGSVATPGALTSATGTPSETNLESKASKADKSSKTARENSKKSERAKK